MQFMQTRKVYHCCFACLLCLITLIGTSRMLIAEQFLTIKEAQNVLFPKATSFEGQAIRFTDAERDLIASRIGEKLRHRGHRIWTATNGEDFQGVMVLDHVLGKHQLIDYAVAISPEGKVLGVEILEYRESHGGEIRQEKWRNQFLGKTSESDLKLHEDIYNISGATISCRHVTEGIRRVLVTYEMVIRPRLDNNTLLLRNPSTRGPR